MKILHVLVAFAATLWMAAPASAHTTIIASNIADGAELAASPQTFEFAFGADVGLAGLELETLAGDAVDIAFQRPSEMGRDFSVPLPDLVAGPYVLKWRAVARDGHVMRGEIDFVVKD